MIIRKATVADAPQIAQCLLLAMEDIVFEFIGFHDHEKALDFMLHFSQLKNNQYSYENCWVACVEGKVVAAANIYDGSALQRLRKPVLDYLAKEFDRNFVPEDETQSGEYYIDTLGVLPRHRGKGIGSRLLRFLIVEYLEKQGKILGLLVDKDNPQAIQLYLNLGFKPQMQKTLMGKKMEHLQCSNSCG